eukprot:TRINITY_DN73563_c0_g1_i1.p1 TRINITY_DN73563_c0_g1~~TRINITY_DN73563_c0_g1_i1.p1  ORF type:complete len:474 (+),score=96.34 TRINITY_DN73563_c0_g1_i1:70-1491(+)
MLIINPALTEDGRSREKLLQSLQSSFLACAFFRVCAEATLAADASCSGDGALSTFIQSLAASFFEAAQDLTDSALRPQTGLLPSEAVTEKDSQDGASSECRPASYEAWVVLLRSIVEDSGVDLDTVAEVVQEVEDEAEEEAAPDSGRWASLSAAQAWAETEIETILDLLISKKTLLELPDIPFNPGTKVLALLSTDDQWHPAVVLREVAWADMWEDGYKPPAAEDEAIAEEDSRVGDAETTAEGMGGESQSAGYVAVADGSGGRGSTSSKQKSTSKKTKPNDIYSTWCQNRFFEVRFTEYSKNQYTRFDKLLLDGTIADDEGVEGMVCEEGECEICKRCVFLTFHHLIPKSTHNRWLKRKRLPEGVRGYESGSRKNMPSSAVKPPTSGGKKPSMKAGGKKSAAATGSCKESSCSSKDENCNRFFLNTYGIMVCRHCHARIHLMAGNMDLAKRYNTLERVLNAPVMQRSVGWKA